MSKYLFSIYTYSLASRDIIWIQLKGPPTYTYMPPHFDTEMKRKKTLKFLLIMFMLQENMGQKPVCRKGFSFLHGSFLRGATGGDSSTEVLTWWLGTSAHEETCDHILQVKYRYAKIQKRKRTYCTRQKNYIHIRCGFEYFYACMSSKDILYTVQL